MPDPAVVHSMKPNVDKAFGPYCTFDPATGIGMAGDWFVEGSVEGAFVSGLEMATLAGRSPIMFNQGQANPYGHVQFEITKNLRQRMREGAEIVSGYSSDSRASTDVGDEWDDLEWEQKVQLKNLRETHVKSTAPVKDLVTKDVMCRYEGCGQWIESKDVNHHKGVCPFRPSRRCVFAECGKYVCLTEIKEHKLNCEFGVYKECKWCFQPIPEPELDDHPSVCLGKPKHHLRARAGGILQTIHAGHLAHAHLTGGNGNANEHDTRGGFSSLHNADRQADDRLGSPVKLPSIASALGHDAGKSGSRGGSGHMQSRLGTGASQRSGLPAVLEADAENSEEGK